MIQTKKSLGQHFLNSPKIIKDIVSAGEITPEDIVVEIGPGEGVMTKELVLWAEKVIAIEKDQRLIPILKEKFKKEIESGKLDLLEKDILEFDTKLLSYYKHPYKVIANIPYYITGQIIRMFLENQNQPVSMTLLIQKEVAERIVARDKKESLLSLSVKAFGEPKIVRTVGKGAFIPPPSVDSAVLNIENISHKKFDGLNEKFFFEVLHAGFAHKRKQLMPNLSSVFTKEKLLNTFEVCGLNPKCRAEDLDIKTWITLCKNLDNNIK